MIAAFLSSAFESTSKVSAARYRQQGIGSKVFKWPQFREAFTDVRVRYTSISSDVSNVLLTLLDLVMLFVLHPVVDPVRRLDRLLRLAHQGLGIQLQNDAPY